MMSINRRTIIVSGARRSGTTLMNQILCCAPNSNPQIGEARLIAKLLDVYVWGNDTYDQVNQWYFPSKEAYKDFFRSSLNEIISNLDSRFNNPDTLVLKAPAFNSLLDEIYEFLPQSRFVFCLRNPLDQVTSEYEVGLRQLSTWKRIRNRASNRDIKKMAGQYMRHYERIFKFIEESTAPCEVFRFEDLVTDPATVKARLADFTGLDLSSFNPDGKWQDFLNESELSKMPAFVPQYGNPIDPSRVGRYREILSFKEIKLIQAICWSIMKKYYPEFI